MLGGVNEILYIDALLVQILQLGYFDLVCWFMFESVVDTVLQIHDITYCYASYFLERQFDVPHIALFA